FPSSMFILQCTRKAARPQGGLGGGASRSATFQSRTVLSQLPVARVLPSGEKASDAIELACAFTVASVRPPEVSQSLTVPPASPDGRVRPSGANGTEKIDTWCPCRTATSAPVSASQSRTTILGKVFTQASRSLLGEKTSDANWPARSFRVRRSRRCLRSHNFT